jgi:hypothetical protein
VLIRRMTIENPLWGGPSIHGELLKLGFEVAQSSIAKYMVKRRGPPSQGWRTFLRNHAPGIAIDLFIAPTIGFDLLYAFVIVRLDRRHSHGKPDGRMDCASNNGGVFLGMMPHLIRDRDRIYGTIVTCRLRWQALPQALRLRPSASISGARSTVLAPRLTKKARRACDAPSRLRAYSPSRAGRRNPDAGEHLEAALAIIR